MKDKLTLAAFFLLALVAGGAFLFASLASALSAANAVLMSGAVALFALLAVVGIGAALAILGFALGFVKAAQFLNKPVIARKPSQLIKTPHSPQLPPVEETDDELSLVEFAANELPLGNEWGW